MRNVPDRLTPLRRVGIGLVLLAGASLPASAGFQEKRSLESASLRLENLIGTVRVEGHAGARFEVEVRVEGRDATPERVRLETREGAEALLAVIFPLGESRRYVYPKLEAGSRVRFRPDADGSGRGWVTDLVASMFGSDRELEVRREGDGLEIWADIVVKVPQGKSLDLAHGVGQVAAAGVRGTLGLSSHAGGVEVSDVEGDTVVDVGSGAVTVRGLRGKLVVDTGSGSVAVRAVAGALVVDTGSGNVKLEDCSGDSISVDTGSGHVEVQSTRTAKLTVDTGSGGVEATGIEADNVQIDTGSGRVTLALTRMGRGHFDVDTGRGGIELRLPPAASAEVRAETGSGSIELDLASERSIVSRDEDSAVVRLGAGEARVLLDAGSGGIRIQSR